MAVLIFIGCDKVGKSTLFKEVLKRTNQHICIDRFTPCQSIYGALHEREDTPHFLELLNFEDFLNDSPIPVAFIHVEANIEDIKKRFEEHNEKDINPSQIKQVLQSYQFYMKSSPLKNKMYVNTSQDSIDDCVEQILTYADTLGVDH